MPVRVDRVGKLDTLLIAYIWSTFDDRHEPAAPVIDSLELRVDAHNIHLDANGGTPAQFGIMRPVVGGPAARNSRPLVQRTDLATLRTIAAAQDLEVVAHAGSVDLHYRLWDDQRKALDQLLRSLGNEP
jgi:hypothetical protein